MTYERGEYNQINFFQLSQQVRKQVVNLINKAASADKVDEHGNWEFDCEFDRKGRGYATNWDLYGIGRDYHNRRLLIVVQVRQYIKRTKNRFPEIKKSYFLIGRNEDDTVFAHPVSGHTVHAAIRNGYDVIERVQRWIFEADYKKVLRHGDVALVPRKVEPKGEEMDYSEMHIQPEEGTASHWLQAEEIRVNGHMYALNPKLEHEPGTHPDIEAKGWYKIMVARRAGFHDFAAPTID